MDYLMLIVACCVFWAAALLLWMWGVKGLDWLDDELTLYGQELEEKNAYLLQASGAIKGENQEVVPRENLP